MIECLHQWFYKKMCQVFGRKCNPDHFDRVWRTLGEGALTCISATTLRFTQRRLRCALKVIELHLAAPENLFQTNFLPASHLGLCKVPFDDKKLKHCLLHSVTLDKNATEIWLMYEHLGRLSQWDYIGSPPGSLLIFDSKCIALLVEAIKTKLKDLWFLSLRQKHLLWRGLCLSWCALVCFRSAQNGV